MKRKWVDQLLLNSGMTSKELAEKLGMTPQNFNSIKCGRGRVTFEKAIAIANATETPFEEIAKAEKEYVVAKYGINNESGRSSEFAG